MQIVKRVQPDVQTGSQRSPGGAQGGMMYGNVIGVSIVAVRAGGD